MRQRYGDRVEFLAVYLREAHPIDGWRSAGNDRLGILIKQPRDLIERRAVAEQCCQALKIRMPVVVDEIDDRVGRAYNASPDRLYIIDSQGRVAYKGGPGPFGYNPAEMEQSLIMLLMEESSLRPSASP